MISTFLTCFIVTLRSARLVGASLLALALSVQAHEGHDHGQPSVELPRIIAPRAEAASDDYELVAVRDGSRLVIYLDNFKTNTPVADAEIEIEYASSKYRARHLRDGVYDADVPELAKPGRHDLQISIQTPRDADLLSARFEVAQAPVAAAVDSPDKRKWIGIGVAALLVPGLVVWAVRRRGRGTRAVQVAIALSLGIGVGPPDAVANGAGSHKGESKGPAAQGAPQAPTVAVGSEAATRLPDGSVFMPKAGQRLFAIRTVVAAAIEEARAMELKGQVVIDPNAGGQVHAPVAGRLSPGPAGLPTLGASVTRGQTLAYLEPTTSALERAGTQAQLAELAGQQAIVESRLQRYAQLEGSIPRKEIENARAEAEALRQRRAALGGALTAREPLVAPVAGRIVSAAASAGQIVAARDLLFVIADPSRLMVEAQAYDPLLAARIADATAVTASGATLGLIPAGVGLQLRDQALPTLFRIRAPVPPLAIGQPIRVFAASAERVSGVGVLPSAIVRNAAGEPVVWLHTAGERFAERRVRIEQVRADLAIAVAGLKAGDRIVTQGATVLAQVR